MTPDIYLHQLAGVETLSVYNAPHKYRIAKSSGNGYYADDALNLWNRMRCHVLKELCNKIRELNLGESFFFSVAPSHTEPFNTHIRAFVEQEFSKSINLSPIFTKDLNFKALGINQTLSRDVLQKNIWINDDGKKRITNEVDKIILIDDVCANGNTFEAMKIAVNEINPKTKFITISILNTTI